MKNIGCSLKHSNITCHIAAALVALLETMTRGITGLLLTGARDILKGTRYVCAGVYFRIVRGASVVDLFSNRHSLLLDVKRSLDTYEVRLFSIVRVFALSGFPSMSRLLNYNILYFHREVVSVSIICSFCKAYTCSSVNLILYYWYVQKSKYKYIICYFIIKIHLFLLFQKWLMKTLCVPL